MSARTMPTALAAWLLTATMQLAAQPPVSSPPAEAQNPPPTAISEPDPSTPTTQDPEPVALDSNTIAALESLAAQLGQKQQARAAANARGDNQAVSSLDRDIRNLDYQFNELASHLDVRQFENPQPGKFDLQGELEQLIRPVLAALKDATSGPRQAADLQARRDDTIEHRRTVERAVAKVRATRSALPADSPARAEATRQLEDYWQPMLNELGGEILVLNANLARMQEQQQPFWTRVTDSTKGFLQNSGLNLVLATLVFVAVFFGLRFVFDSLLRYYRGKRGFSRRLTEVMLRVLTVMLAIAAMLVVPYAREDWLLQAIAIVFLVGAGWVVVKMAPQFFEQFRLILNIGSVREGERILMGGLPFRVDALRFYSRLVNPDLTGGALRVPINELIGQRSRPLGDDEPWFPCRQGDVVALADGVVGKVLLQTPEVVIVAERKDAPRSYPTTAFLAQNPRNLSQGFEIVVRFGVDYRHQQQATAEVPAALQRAVKSGLEQTVATGELHHVHCELAAAGNSSIDFLVICEFDGSAAGRYHELDRRINTLLLAACNEQGFGIPFPQLTVHQAGGAAVR